MKILEWIAYRVRLIKLRGVWKEEWRCRVDNGATVYRATRRIYPRSRLRYEMLARHGAWEEVFSIPTGLVEFVDVYGNKLH